MFFDELKLHQNDRRINADSALMLCVQSTRTGKVGLEMRIPHLYFCSTDILSLRFRCLYSVSAHAPDVASRPLFKVSDLSGLMAGNQRANAPRFLVISLFCLCFFSTFASRLRFVSVSSLSVISRFSRPKLRFCEVFRFLFLSCF